jgi:hypothetical protein
MGSTPDDFVEFNSTYEIFQAAKWLRVYIASKRKKEKRLFRGGGVNGGWRVGPMIKPPTVSRLT